MADDDNPVGVSPSTMERGTEGDPQDVTGTIQDPPSIELDTPPTGVPPRRNPDLFTLMEEEFDPVGGTMTTPEAETGGNDDDLPPLDPDPPSFDPNVPPSNPRGRLSRVGGDLRTFQSEVGFLRNRNPTEAERLAQQEMNSFLRRYIPEMNPGETNDEHARRTIERLWLMEVRERSIDMTRAERDDLQLTADSQ